MGKYKSRRYKLHASAPSNKLENKANPPPTITEAAEISIPEINSNVFKGIDILSLLKDAPKRPFDDDTVSVKSYVSNKSIKGESVIPKKEKRKLKRQLLLKKIDTLNQMKKELKQNEKEKEQKLGDVQSLLNNLPMFEPSAGTNDKQSGTHFMVAKKKKAIESSRTIQKTTIKNVNFYKKLLKNPVLAKDPFGTISEHLKAMVEREREGTKELDKNLVQKKKEKK